MASDAPQLGRSLLGYRRTAVRQILADRETMFLVAKGRAERAEDRVEELQAELETVRGELGAQEESTDAMLAEAHAGLESANAALKTRGEQVDAAQAQVARLGDELEAARAEVEDARAEVEARTEEIETAEARTTELQAQLEAAREELVQREQQSPSPVLATEELSSILETAERGVTGIMERTRRAYEEQLAQTQEARRAIQSEIDHFGDWRAHVEPRIRSVQQGIDAARERIARVPDQIQEAVGSMAEAIDTVNDSLEHLATLPGPISDGESTSEGVTREGTGGDEEPQTSEMPEAPDGPR